MSISGLENANRQLIDFSSNGHLKKKNQLQRVFSPPNEYNSSESVITKYMHIYALYLMVFFYFVFHSQNTLVFH